MLILHDIHSDLKITKDLVGVCSIHGQTTTEEISNDTPKCITEKINLIFNKLVGIRTDGVPSIDRKSTVLLHFLSDHADYNVLQYHIFILSNWTIKFQYMMSTVLAVMKHSYSH